MHRPRGLACVNCKFSQKPKHCREFQAGRCRHSRKFPAQKGRHQVMPFLLVRHKSAAFSTWKAAYDAHLPPVRKQRLNEKHLLRNIDNPNEVILFFDAEDCPKRGSLVAGLTYAKPCRRLESLISRIFIFSLNAPLRSNLRTFTGNRKP